MDVRDLSYLQAIIDKGSVVAAAEALGRTPPALTKAIRRLEDDVGCPLFTKSGRGIEPTEAAMYLANQTRGIDRRLSSLRADIRGIVSGQAGLVRMGVSATMVAIYLPELTRRMATDMPDMRITLVNGMNNVLRRALRDGDLDVVLGVFDGDDDDDIDGFVVANDRVRVVASVGHRLMGKPLDLADLVDERWVLPSRAVKMRQWFDAAFTLRGCAPPEPHIETTSIAILETLIADSDYLSFVSNWKVGTRLSRHRLAALDVPDLVMPRKFGLVWSRVMPPSKAATVLIEYVRKMVDTAA